MRAFFERVAEVKAADAELRTKLAAIEQLHAESRSAVRSEAVRALRERTSAEVSAVSAIAAKSKRVIEALIEENRAVLAEHNGVYSAAMRSREAMTVAMQKRLKATMEEFIALRAAIQEDYKKTVERRVFTVTGERPDDDALEELIDTGESESVFQRAILEQGRGQVMDTVAEIHERREAVQEIEQGLLALHQMFTDLATLVDQQGETIDSIELHVEKASDFTAEASQQLTVARKYQLSTQRYRLICLVLLVGIGAAIALVVLRITGVIG